MSLDIKPLVYLSQHISFGAIIISCVSLVLLFNWPKLKSKKLISVRAPVIVVLLGIAANFVFEQFFPLLHLARQEYLVTIPQVEKLLDVKQLLNFPDWSAFGNINVYYYALLIAVITSIETLLNLEAAERLDKQKR